MIKPPLPMHSPFHPRSAGHQATASGAIGVHLKAHTLASLTRISTWHSGLDALESTLARALACTPPPHTGQVVPTLLGQLMRSGPLEFLLVGNTGSTGPFGSDKLPQFLRESITPELGAVTDWSHARCRIRMEGANCQHTLRKLFALDLREVTFPIGDMRLTGTHHVPSLLHRLTLDCLDWYVPTSYAQDQLDTLQDAAREFGVATTLEQH